MQVIASLKGISRLWVFLRPVREGSCFFSPELSATIVFSFRMGVGANIEIPLRVFP